MSNKQNNWKERFEEDFLRYISHGFPREIVLENMQVFIEKEIALAKKQTLQEVEEKIRSYPDRLFSIMPDGKLPFVVFEGVADEKEKRTIYLQAFKDILSVIKQEDERV